MMFDCDPTNLNMQPMLVRSSFIVTNEEEEGGRGEGGTARIMAVSWQKFFS